MIMVRRGTPVAPAAAMVVALAAVVVALAAVVAATMVGIVQALVVADIPATRLSTPSAVTVAEGRRLSADVSE